MYTAGESATAAKIVLFYSLWWEIEERIPFIYKGFWNAAEGMSPNNLC